MSTPDRESNALPETPRESEVNQISTLDATTTADGSLTFYSAEFNQHFHNLHGAREEALEKFTLPCHIPLLARNDKLCILDVCFGLGYNSGVAIALIQRLNPDCRILLYALERSPEVSLQAHQMGVWSEWNFAEDWLHMVRDGYVCTSQFEGIWHGGDARQSIAEVPENSADAVFFDPFASSACPELWTVDFFAAITRCMKPKGRLATYSCSATVRAALLEAGFAIGSTPAVGRVWPGTVASLTPGELPPLSQYEREHLQTRAAVPYRDPGLCETRDRIRTQRQQAQQRSQLEPTTQWKRRWTGRP